MSKPKSDAGALLREVTRLYVRAQRLVADCCDTTNTQCLILLELGRTGPIPMSELGTCLLLEKSWVSRAIDVLVERELVGKSPNPDDARSWLVALTPAGMRRVKALEDSLDGHAEALLASLGERERLDVRRALGLLLHALRSDATATCCLPASERRQGVLQQRAERQRT